MSENLAIGSLFSGYGGLDLAVEAVTGATPAWFCEFDPAPSKVLAHHWPGVPNHRDVTQINWRDVEPVDILTGGSPCQDLSAAGKRAGMTEGTRSNLWVNMREAINHLRPRLVVWENLQGALIAPATSDSDMEPATGLLGNTGGGHLRALGRVLGDLTEIGYDAEWTTLRASDVGAPHHRARIFLIAWPRTTDPDGQPIWQHPGGTPTEETRTQSSHRPSDPRGERPTENRRNAPHPESRGWGDGQATDNRAPHREIHAPDNHRDAVTDTQRDDGGQGPRQSSGGTQTERPTTTSGLEHRGGSPTDTERIGRQWRGATPAQTGGAQSPTDRLRVGNRSVEWGKYAPAIRRWERVLGVAAPNPTEPNTKGNPRLAAPFAEWMMGLPNGWVTAPEIGLTRAQQLKAIGNGVVPQQAQAALTHLLERESIHALVQG